MAISRLSSGVVRWMGHRPTQTGAALLSALLVVALAATLVAALFGRENVAIRSVENRSALAQVRWIERATLDWARAVVLADLRSSSIDHAGEPWAVPVVDTRLDETVTAGARLGDRDRAAVLAGRIVDAQAWLNLTGMGRTPRGQTDPLLASFEKLLDLLGLPNRIASALDDHLRESGRTPRRLADLAGVEGFDETVISALEPYVSFLPEPTPVNLNTAPAEVIAAAVQTVDLGSARRFVVQRERTPLRSLAEASAQFSDKPVLEPARLSVSTRYFLVTGVIRYDRVETQSETLLDRSDNRVQIVWQDRF